MSTNQPYTPNAPAIPAGAPTYTTSPACPACGSIHILHFMGAIRDGKPVGVYSCLECGHRFSSPARRMQPDEDHTLSQSQELASIEEVAAARAQAKVPCPICGCRCAGGKR